MRKGWKPSRETRAKISAALARKPQSLEHRAKISAAPTGRRFSPEHRANMSAAKKGIGLIPETREMTEAQIADFRLFRRKGFSKSEAAALVFTGRLDAE